MRFSIETLQQCWFLAGPTASGKSSVGLHLARHLDAEIVSLDSMSLYRGMDIGTAKPSPEQRLRIPHHLIDLLEPHQQYSLAEYVEAAEAACRDILNRQRTPLLVGGTALYLRGVLRGVFDGPAADWEFRHAAEAEAAENPPGTLHERLQKIDSAAARQIHRNDTRRLVRALEVFHITGQPLSEQQQQTVLPHHQRPRHVYWLAPPRKWLYDRIDRRVEAMFAEGLVAEVQKLLDASNAISHTARQALGYKEIIDGLNNDTSLGDCLSEIQTRTRQFAKRQHTWFRNLEECQAIEFTGSESPELLAERIFSFANDTEHSPGEML